MSEEQADAVAEAMRDARIVDLSHLATKTDLEILRRDMTIWLGGMIVVATGIIIAAIRYLPPQHG
jgi:hypothetical protein